MLKRAFDRIYHSFIILKARTLGIEGNFFLILIFFSGTCQYEWLVAKNTEARLNSLKSN